MRKEMVTFIALILLVTSLVTGILFLNSKREIAALKRASAQPSAPTPATAEKKVAKLPILRTYVSPIALPAPKLKGTTSVEEALQIRRSRREFATKPVTLPQLSQMLWAAQGITVPGTNKRTAPSAREVYPYTVYVVVRNVTGLAPGLYEYLPKEQALGDMKLAGAITAFDASGVEAGAKKAPVTLLLAAAFDKGLEALKAGAVSSTYLEGGHIGENLYLEAESLKLAMVVMGGGTQAAHDAMKLDPAETVVYVIPFGLRAPASTATPTPKGTE